MLENLKKPLKPCFSGRFAAKTSKKSSKPENLKKNFKKLKKTLGASRRKPQKNNDFQWKSNISMKIWDFQRKSAKIKFSRIVRNDPKWVAMDEKASKYVKNVIFWRKFTKMLNLYFVQNLSGMILWSKKVVCDASRDVSDDLFFVDFFSTYISCISYIYPMHLIYIYIYPIYPPLSYPL